MQSQEKLQSSGLRFFLGYFYNVLRLPKVYIDKKKKKKIDPFTNVYYTWNAYLTT